MILLDFSQIVISNLHAELQGQTDVEINLPLLRHMVINTIRSLKVKFSREYGSLIIATDSRKYWRKEAFQYYKANRKKAREDSGLDWNEIFKSLDLIKSEIEAVFPYPVLNIDGAEADDVIATLVEWTQKNDLNTGMFDEGEPQPVLILSGDGDFEQLQRHKNVKQYSPIHKKWILAQGTPDEVVMEHILAGDKSDGVPNFLSADNSFVNGIRQKSLFKANLELWRTQKVEEFITDPKSELMKNFKRNQQLIDLRCIPKAIKKDIIKQYGSKRNVERDRTKILNYFIQNRMKLLIESTGDF